MSHLSHKLILVALILLMQVSVSGAAPNTPLNMQPLYGLKDKTQTEINADKRFIQKVVSTGHNRKEAAKKTVHKAWGYFHRGDMITAMKRFNQAWLLDPNNGDIYHGFAVLIASRNGSPELINKFFQMAVSKQNQGSSVYVDYGWFLIQKGNYAAAERVLKTSLRKNPNARNAKRNLAIAYFNQRNFRDSCYWAKLAQENNDDTHRSFMKDMCQR